MPLRFSCPCGQKLKARDDTVAKHAKCPKCHRWLKIPESETYDTIAAEEAPHRAHANAAPPGSAIAHDESPEEDHPTDLVKARVVVVDSDKPELAHTIGILRDHGYIVIEATDGETAIEKIRAEQPDVIVADIRLDRLSGFQLVQQIRNLANPANKEVWEIPILMTASRLRGRDKQYAMSLGVDDYFIKPVTPAQFCARLEKCVEKNRARLASEKPGVALP